MDKAERTAGGTPSEPVQGTAEKKQEFPFAKKVKLPEFHLPKREAKPDFSLPAGERGLRFYIREVIKWAIFLLVAVFCIRSLASGKVSSADFQDVSKAVLGAADLSEMQEGDGQLVRRFYRLTPDEFKGVTLMYPVDNMKAQEIFLVELSDTAQQDAVVKAINDRIDTQKKSFKGYGVSQYEMLEKSIVDVQGNYILFVSADDPEKVDQAFKDAL
ncbi:MAG: DUF4358 domain-containing protein [Eubacterium sp.]|nr:DUF4358 domain-containing protein [Eubacterium sp.]